MNYVIIFIISVVVGCLFGWAIWKPYFNHKMRQRYFYVSFYTTKQVGGECKIIYGSYTFVSYDGLYLNKNEVIKKLSEVVDTNDSIVILNIVELKREDYHYFVDN